MLVHNVVLDSIQVGEEVEADLGKTTSLLIRRERLSVCFELSQKECEKERRICTTCIKHSIVYV